MVYHRLKSSFFKNKCLNLKINNIAFSLQDGSYLAEFLISKGYEVRETATMVNGLLEILNTSRLT